MNIDETKQIVPNDIHGLCLLKHIDGLVKLRGKGEPHPGYGPEYRVPSEWEPPTEFELVEHTVEYGPDAGATVYLLQKKA